MSTIIKAGSSARASECATYNLEEMSAPAELDQARAQAAAIIARAEADADEIRRQAEEQGRAAALETAQQIHAEKANRQLAAVTATLGDAIGQIEASRATWLAHWEKTAVHVAAAMASRVVRRELARQPEITLDLVREALELAAGSGQIQLRMHPSDVATLGTQVEALCAELTRLGKAQIIADPQISPGGCRVDTRYGVIDQQFEAQLARIEQELT